MKNFPGPFRSPRMFKYKEKTAFTYNIQSVVHSRKFSMKQNVLHYCCLFSIWTTRKMHDFHDIFTGLSRTLSFNFQDFPGPKWFSRTFQVWNFQEKIQDFPGGVGTLPVEMCGPFPFCNSISSQSIILTKFRLTGTMIMVKLSFRPGNVHCDGKLAPRGLGMPDCRNSGPGNGVPMRSHPL